MPGFRSDHVLSSSFTQSKARRARLRKAVDQSTWPVSASTLLLKGLLARLVGGGQARGAYAPARLCQTAPPTIKASPTPPVYKASGQLPRLRDHMPEIRATKPARLSRSPSQAPAPDARRAPFLRGPHPLAGAGPAARRADCCRTGRTHQRPGAACLRSVGSAGSPRALSA
jgi:hypothetical protein